MSAWGQKNGGNDNQRYLFTQASLMMSEHYNDSALKMWMRLYKLDSNNNANVCYYIGQMLLETPAHKADALPYLEKAASHVVSKYAPDDPYEKNAPALAYYFLGRALHLNYQFSDAVVNINLFKKLLSKNDPRQKDIDYWVACCNNGMELMKDPVDCKITNMGDSINTIYPDYSPLVTADEQQIFFTSQRLGGPNGPGSDKDSNGFYNENIWMANARPGGGWTTSKSLGDIINAGGNRSSVFISSDGMQLVIFKENQGGGGNLMVSYLRGAQWSYTASLDTASPGAINGASPLPGACFSPDQKTLYFVSNRPGGYGGTDIYKVNLDSGGKWGAPINLGPTINTEYDEASPFVHTDGTTLFFSSKGHNTMGGFDVFMSQMDSGGKWGNVKNLGYPVNTPDDDIYFSASADGRRAYYSSIRKGGYGEKDIYEITFNQPLPVNRVAILVGYLKTPDGSPLPNDIVVKTTMVKNPNSTQQTKVNTITGKFLQDLKPNQTYNVVISSGGKDVFNQNFYLPADSSYFTLSRAFFRTSITLGDTSNVFVPKPKIPMVTMLGGMLLNDLPLKPMSNMAIQLIDSKGQVLHTTLTDKDGHFTFDNLPIDQSYTLEVDVTDPKLKHLKKLYLANSKGKIVRTFDDSKADNYLYHDLPANLDNLSEMSRIAAIPPKPVRIVSPDADYIEYFKYNADQSSDKESSFNALVTKIAAKTLKKDTVYISIESSASKVPTGSQFANSNWVLAGKRAEAAKTSIINALKKRHAKYQKVKFEIKATVQGPDYDQDAQDQDKYQNYQYVKVFIKQPNQ